MHSLKQLLNLMVHQNYSDASLRDSPEDIHAISSRCRDLVLRDYEVEIIPNTDGSLCSHYPPLLFIPRSDASPDSTLPSLISNAKFARGRSRFVAPAFSFRDKFICRSSTLSGSLELYGRQVAGAAGLTFDSPSTLSYTNQTTMDLDDDRSTLNRVRDDDCELMKRFRIRYICDLMLEYRKIKYWLPVTSSEKADNHNRYHEFVILALPYPGSEFFRLWKDSGYRMRGLMFDWQQPAIEVQLKPDSLPQTLLSSHVDWSTYKLWDVTTLTINYLKLLLGLLFEGAGGLLLHCVSGWDRTPLFISLMRCLLWADDLAHRSLQPEEMLYYTLAYDWFLFGHQLRTRMDSGEEILYFAFRFLAEVAADSSLSIRAVYDMVMPTEKRTADSKQQTLDFVEVQWSPTLLQIRQSRLEQLTALFIQTWTTVIDALEAPPGQQMTSVSPLEQMNQSERKAKSFELNDVFKAGVISQVSNAVSTAAYSVVSGFRKPPTEVRTTEAASIPNVEPSLD